MSKTEFVVKTPETRALAVDFIGKLGHDRAWLISIVEHKVKRSDAQNRLQQRYNNIIAEGVEDQDFEDIRAFNKLHFGVPILRRDNDDFCAEYDEMFRPLPYEQKLHIIKMFDIAVTRKMNVKQKTEYLELMAKHWAEQGVYLPSPDDQGR